MHREIGINRQMFKRVTYYRLHKRTLCEDCILDTEHKAIFVKHIDFTRKKIRPRRKCGRCREFTEEEELDGAERDKLLEILKKKKKGLRNINSYEIFTIDARNRITKEAEEIENGKSIITKPPTIVRSEGNKMEENLKSIHEKNPIAMTIEEEATKHLGEEHIEPLAIIKEEPAEHLEEEPIEPLAIMIKEEPTEHLEEEPTEPLATVIQKEPTEKLDTIMKEEPPESQEETTEATKEIRGEIPDKYTPLELELIKELREYFGEETSSEHREIKIEPMTAEEEKDIWEDIYEIIIGD